MAGTWFVSAVRVVGASRGHFLLKGVNGLYGIPWHSTACLPVSGKREDFEMATVSEALEWQAMGAVRLSGVSPFTLYGVGCELGM